MNWNGFFSVITWGVAITGLGVGSFTVFVGIQPDLLETHRKPTLIIGGITFVIGLLAAATINGMGWA